MAFHVGSIEVLQKPATSPDANDSNYAGLHPSTQLLRKGHKKASENRALQADTLFDRDITIILRDDVKLRADVFRPNHDGKVPALLAWSPYGKTGTGFWDLNLITGRVGVQKDTLSGYEKFEGPDPAEWVARGYAIVNIDARGTFDSEGDIRWFGTAEGRDGYDAIEEISALPWCNGKVGLVGCSWLATAQWFIAAEKPPHLACIAPLEGAADPYREYLCRGGVPSLAFIGFLSTKLYGRNQQEDIISMLFKYPFMNEYWMDKRADFSKIDVPAYILASYSTALHTIGSFRAFEDTPHDQKWLRVHPTQEWHDLYQQETVEDLCRFFDHYLKGEQNRWQETAKVRLSMLQYNQDPIVNHPFSSWPIPSTRYQTFFLDADKMLVQQPSSRESELSYQSDAPAYQVDADSEELIFSRVFESRTHLVGYSRAVLYMSCLYHTDLDVFVQIRKGDKNGKLLQNFNIPLADMRVQSTAEIAVTNSNVYLGPAGILRASHRATNASLSSPHWAVHDHSMGAVQPVTVGEIVRLDIGVWPTGMVFEAGEQLVLKIAGHQLTLVEIEALRGTSSTGNRGRHVLHVGGRYESHLVVPFIELP